MVGASAVKRLYSVQFVTEVLLDVDSAVIDATQTEQWRHSFYTLTRDDAVAMVARMCGIDGRRLSMAGDGFADRDDADVVVRHVRELAADVDALT